MSDGEAPPRLAWLLVFRAVVATCLLGMTLSAEVTNLPVRLLASLLYGVGIANYAVVLLLGLLLRGGYSPAILGTVYLSTTVLSGAAVVSGSGGLSSPLSFFFLLAVLDGAIIGGRTVALAVATVSSILHGLLIALELYGITLVPAVAAGDSEYLGAFVLHTAAYYLSALLAGQLALQLARARAQVSSVRADLAVIEATQASLLESLPVGVLGMSSRGVTVLANRAAGEVLGESVGALVGRDVPAPLRQAVERGLPNTNVVWSSPRGPRQLSVTVATQREPQREDGVSHILVFEDRTEVVELAEAMGERSRLAAVGELAGALAHELRNPLAAISGSVELLASLEIGPTETGRLQEIVLRETKRLNEVISDFLAYARPSPPRRSAFDVVPLLRDLVAASEERHSARKVRGRVDAPSGLTVSADPEQLRRIFTGVVGFAFELAVAHDIVAVDVRPESEAVRTGLSLDLRVRHMDLPGFAWERVFEPFAITLAGRSTLALAVAQRLAEAHGGSLAARSDAGVLSVRLELHAEP